MRNITVLTVFFSAFVLALGQAPASSQKPQTAQATDEQIQAELSKTAAATIAWEKSTTSGTKAEVQLLKKDQAEGKPVMQYRVKLNGAPRNKLYSLIAWPITVSEPVTMMEGLAIAADGTVGCPPDSTKNCAQRIKGAELKLTYTPGIGEIYRHALISEDRQSRIFFSIVPAPMVETDKLCSVEVIRLSPRFELAVIHGKGFTPGELLSFHTQSYQEVNEKQPKVDPSGDFWAVLTPFVKGRTMGTTQVTVKSKHCAPQLSFEWGSE